MKGSLMVEGDRMCTCQKGNQLKLWKKEKWRSEKKVSARVSHWDTFASKVLWGRIKALWICVCNLVKVWMCVCGCVHVRFCIFSIIISFDCSHFQSSEYDISAVICRGGWGVSAVRNRWGCNIWAVRRGWVQYWNSTAAERCSRKPDHLNQQIQAPTHSSFLYKTHRCSPHNFPCSSFSMSSRLWLFYCYCAPQQLFR